jgi:hypothetical protein
MTAASWLRQPTTITGIAAVLATAVGGVAQVLTGDATVTAVAGGLIYGAVHLVINDNTVATDVAQLAETGAEMAIGGAPMAAGLSRQAIEEIKKLLLDTLTIKPDQHTPPAAG